MLRIRFSLAVLGAMLAFGAASSDAEARHCRQSRHQHHQQCGVSHNNHSHHGHSQYGSACCSTGGSDWDSGYHHGHSGHQSGYHMSGCHTNGCHMNGHHANSYQNQGWHQNSEHQHYVANGQPMNACCSSAPVVSSVNVTPAAMNAPQPAVNQSVAPTPGI